MRELQDTIELMNSNDFKQRLIGEYAQVFIRLTKLRKCLYPIGAPDKLMNEETWLLIEQKTYMEGYMKSLGKRLDLYNISTLNIKYWVLKHEPLRSIEDDR